MSTASPSPCPLCVSAGEPALWRDDRCRIISAGDADHPGFLRVVWQSHVGEMTDLKPLDQAHLFAVVLAVEQALRDVLAPDKINLASLGNQVPHLHWHVIPRFRQDAHFPDAVWAPRRREGNPEPADLDRVAARLRGLLGP